MIENIIECDHVFKPIPGSEEWRCEKCSILTENREIVVKQNPFRYRVLICPGAFYCPTDIMVMSGIY